MDAWVDIDNPPQVQYLSPLAAALSQAGFRVWVTARDHTITKELLAQRGIEAEVVGHAFGRSRLAKIRGLLGRTREVRRRMRARAVEPDLTLSGSRSSVVASRLARVPTFVLCDYEYTELSLYRRMGAYLVHPRYIPTAAFEARGWNRERLIAFDGLKEHLTFADYQALNSEPLQLRIDDPNVRMVLLRPPAEESHYYTSATRALTLAVLELLANRTDWQCIVAPRHDWQIDDLRRLTWRHEPVVLKGGVPFAQLLASVDLVVCGGGTMLREAAYLGLPACSLFQSRLGAVDAYLAREGRVVLASAAGNLVGLLDDPRKREPLPSQPDLPAQLVAQLVDRAKRRLT